MPEKQYADYTVKVEANDEENTITAVINTGTVDRDKEVLLPKGADLAKYRKNPVVLFGHNYSEPPIGKALWVKRTPEALTAKWKAAETDKAQEIYSLYKGGFLKAFSVGFIPVKSHTPTPDDIKKAPEWAEATRVYDKWDLLEFSAVPVPANPEALALAVKTKELSLSAETKEWLGVEEKIFYMDKADEFNCECIDCGHKLVSEKHCNEIKCPKCGGEMRRLERPGPGRGIELDALTADFENYSKPYPNEHACRLENPNDFDKFNRVTCGQKHNGKCIDVIYGVKAGKSKIQALRYPKKIWTASAAKSHCKTRDGSFEAAKEVSLMPKVMPKTHKHISLKSTTKADLDKEAMKLAKARFKGEVI